MRAFHLFLSVLLASFSLPASPSFQTYARDGAVVLAATNGQTRVRHDGGDSWAVYRDADRMNVRAGDRFRLAGTVGAIRDGGRSGILLGAILTGTDGKALNWRYGCTKLQADGHSETTFVAPVDGALAPRIFGQGKADFDLGDLTFERTGRVEPPADLPERFSLDTSALRLEIDRADLALAVTDKRTGRTWRTDTKAASYPHFTVRKFTSDGRGLRLGVTDVETGAPLAIVFQTEKDAPTEFTVTVSGRGTCKGNFAYPDPIQATEGDHLILPLSEGFRLPMCSRSLISSAEFKMWSPGCCMAFFGVEEDSSGAGWMAIAETRNDAIVRVTADGDVPVAVGPVWAPERGMFGSPRAIRYVFQDKGGYVAMAKRYRRTATARGLVKTFREKTLERPAVDRLLGAANVWYFQGHGEPSHAAVAQELKDAGIDRFLWSSDCPPSDVAKIAALPDVLSGRYDVYRDIYPPELCQRLGWKTDGYDICRNTAAWPDSVIWNSPSSNDLRRAWGVTCPDGVKRYSVAQCTLCQPAHVREHVASELKTKPFTARFIDVTTAIGAEECENPAHPMTRTQSRAAGCELLRILGDEFKLVVGSEQGVDFAVPVCDYFEGMLSPGPCRMPHGRKGANRGDIFREGEEAKNVTAEELARVTEFGLGERYRIPLFELVFHDCCCSHWYWYDYSNRPLNLWKKRDLFNVLYGTAPMYIFDHRLWSEQKDRFVRSYRTTCPVARQTGYSEMTDHRALTADRRVQRSTFADGTVVTVNFGDAPYRLEDGRTLAPQTHDVTQPAVRFGLVTDIHFSDIPPDTRAGRYYGESRRKLDEAVAVFNARDLDFVIELGDLKDLSKDKTSTLACLDEIERRLAAFRGPRYHAVGNHDFDCLTPDEFLSHVTNAGQPMTSGYYSFDVKGIRFVVLDACYDSTLKHYSCQNPWDDANVPPEELAWLEKKLTSAPGRVVVFCHQRLDTSAAPRHDVKNAAAVRTLLEKSGKVAAVITGHEHTGGYAVVNGIPYYSMRGMISGTGDASNSYAEVAVYADGRFSVTGWRTAVSRKADD